MRAFIFILSLACGLGAISSAGSQDVSAGADHSPGPNKSGGVVMVGISPFLEASVKDSVYRGLVRLIVEDLPLNTTLEVYDAYNLKSIAQLSVPGAKVFHSLKTRANQFALPIGEIRQFLARTNARPAGAKSAFTEAVRLPQFCDFLARNRPARAGSAGLPLLLIGSPLYQDAREPGFSMVDGYFPSDGHLGVSREQSVFGLNPGGGETSAGPQIYWAYFEDPWISDVHREKVARFWALYLERRGGRLASLSGDLVTALNAFKAEAPGPSAAANGWAADSKQTKPEMLRVTRGVKLVDWLTGDAVTQSTPPAQMVGPLKIGIRWKDNIDLDLYAAPRRDAETLFFQHPRSPEGAYFKDQRSSPGREYEFIEFDAPIDIRNLRAYVNFYAGSCPGGPRGEVRIEFLNHIYSGTFAIASAEGNEGRSGASQSEFWTQIPVQRILGLAEPAPQSASAAR